MGGRHNSSTLKREEAAGLTLADWASAKGPRVAAAGGGGGGGGGSGATAGAVPSDGDGQTAAAAAASTPAPRPKRVVRRRRHLHGEGDGVNADAQSAKERPFDHMANAVGTGKRLIQMELLLPWMERHLCCRKCSETAAKQNLTAFAAFLEDKFSKSGINFMSEVAKFRNGYARHGGLRSGTATMTVKSEKMHGVASEMVFQCDELPRPGRAVDQRGHIWC